LLGAFCADLLDRILRIFSKHNISSHTKTSSTLADIYLP
jgi:hypothetical protein